MAKTFDEDGAMTDGAERETYAGLDSLRGLAALAVLTTHTAFWAGQYGDGFWGAISPRLDIGVAVFFVLSGFLLAQPFLAAMADRRSLPGVRRYWWKRAVRVLPLYWVTVVIALTTLHANRDATLGDWIANLTVTDLYRGPFLNAGLTHMWSLSTEVAFYLLLPLLMAGVATTVCRRRWNPGGVLAVLAVLGGVTVVWHLLRDQLPSAATLWLPTYLTWFGAGIALALIRIEMRRGSQAGAVRVWAALSRQPGVCWIFAVSTFAVITTPVAGSSFFAISVPAESLTKNLLYALFAWFIILPSALRPQDDSRYARALAHPGLRRLGHISYGVFCLHLVIIHGVAHVRGIDPFGGRGFELWILTVLFSVAAAEAAYRLIEAPSRRLRSLGVRSKAITTTTASDATNSP